MNKAQLLELLADVDETEQVIIAIPHWSKLLGPDGEPPIGPAFGYFDIGAEIEGITKGADSAGNRYTRLCIGGLIGAYTSPCETCDQQGCNAKGVNPDDVEVDL